ncbi:MAG: IS21 family transposase [Ardenticatenaceae bacterium]|nr:IS21 family transposase [Ardenticatenaceae bacterium]
MRRTLPETPPPQNVSSVEPYRAMVSQLHKEGVEMTAILQRLKERGYQGSYSSVRRFVNGLAPSHADIVVRVECQPGEEAQVDFGSAGLLIDPETGQVRRAWAFVMTLSWSRHEYVEFVFDQKLATWLLLHRHAFEWFGGVPARIVVDNLKAAIVRACCDDPLVQQAYRECAEHDGFLIAPCQPGRPEHKGKVEQGGVHYVKRNFLAGREPTPSPTPTRRCGRGATPPPGCASTARPANSRWCAFRRPSRRTSSRCPRRRTTWPSGKKGRWRPMAISPSTTPTTRCPATSLRALGCGCVAAPNSSPSTPWRMTPSPPTTALAGRVNA